MRPSAIRRTAPCAASSLSERANRWAKRSAGSPVIRKLMTVLLGNFEPPLERDPRRLSFRFLLSNSSTSPPSAAQCAARLGVRTALDYDLGANGRPSPSGRRRAGDQMGTLLAKNADVVVTMDGQRRELRNAGLFARDGMIENVGPTAELPRAPTSCSICGGISCFPASSTVTII